MNSEWLSLIGLLLLWLIPALIKSGKKVKKPENAVPEKEESDDPWERIWDFSDSKSAEEERQIPEVLYEDVMQPASFGASEINHFRPVARKVQPSAPQKGQSSENIFSRVTDTLEESREGESPQFGFIEEFDLKEAVIYSEILKPKFND